MDGGKSKPKRVCVSTHIHHKRVRDHGIFPFRTTNQSRLVGIDGVSR